MLRSQRNTKTMEARVMRAFKKWYWRGISPNQRRLDRQIFNPSAFFEHGHWWAENKTTGAQFDACDAEGTTAAGVFDGFTFEQVSRGDSEGR